MGSAALRVIRRAPFIEVYHVYHTLHSITYFLSLNNGCYFFTSQAAASGWGMYREGCSLGDAMNDALDELVQVRISISISNTCSL